MLTDKQKKTFTLMEKGKNLFITGMGGTGKSFVINLFREKYNNTKKIGITSTTGISALLINGVTLHSFLGIGLGDKPVDVLYNNIFRNKRIRDRWCKLEVLIIDEVSMLLPDLLDKIEELARMIKQSSKPFGGIQLILSGDMLQLPPVKSEKFCFEAKCWKNCIEHTIYLTENLRQNNKEFQDCLSELRKGTVSEKNEKLLKTRENVDVENSFGISPTKICSLNSEVDEINYKKLLELNEPDIYEYEIEIEMDKPGLFLPKIEKCCNLVECLQLCKGAQVMLLTNLNAEDGLVNGSRGVVIDFVEDLPLVQFLNGDEILIDYHTVDIEKNDTVIGRITQIPLRVAYAVSAHKIQGHTLDCCEIDLKNFFDYGQAYVALSRVKSLDSLKLKNFSVEKIKAHPKAINYYKNISV